MAKKAEEKKEIEEKPDADTALLEQDKPLDTPDADDDGRQEEVEVKDAADELKAQIETLRRSEQEQRQRAAQAEADRAKAVQLANERDVALSQHQVSAATSRFEAITAAMGAAQTAAEAAQRDIEFAIGAGDGAAQADAYRRLARAEADLSRLEDGKTAAEEEIAREKVRAKQLADAARAQAEAAANDPLARANIPEAAKTWLRAHPDYLTDQRKNSKLQALHWDVLDEGHAAFSPEYFNSIEQHLGLKAASKVEKVVEEDEDGDKPERKPYVSAPVTRQVPGNTPSKPTAATLTRAEREAAKLAGITEVEYAKQKQALIEAKANGLYNN